MARSRTHGTSITVCCTSRSAQYEIARQCLAQTNLTLRTLAIVVANKQSDYTPETGRDQQDNKHEPTDLRDFGSYRRGTCRLAVRALETDWSKP